MFKMMKNGNGKTSNCLRDALLKQKSNGVIPSDENELNIAQKALLDICIQKSVRDWMLSINLNLYDCDMYNVLENNTATLKTALHEFEKCRLTLDMLQEQLENIKENPTARFHERYAHVTLPSDEQVLSFLKSAVPTREFTMDNPAFLWKALSCSCMTISSMLSVINMKYNLYLSGGASV